ncbi:hypothetical protein ACS0TY_006479 [Phlomoides rotata]
MMKGQYDAFGVYFSNGVVFWVSLPIMDSAGGANFRTPVDPSTFASNSLHTQEAMYTADEFLTRTKLICQW